MINNNSLLNSRQHLEQLEFFKSLLVKYNQFSKSIKVIFYELSFSKFKRFPSSLLGKLCIDLTENPDNIEKLVVDYNKFVDPANYMKTTRVISPAEKQKAQQFIEENNYTNLFDRELATLNDIKVDQILFANGSNNKVKVASIFDDLPTKQSSTDISDKNKVDVPISDFMNQLDKYSSVELYLENKHKNNLCALIKDKNPNGKNLFKWNNNYCVTYKNNLSGISLIEEKVKEFGGKIEAKMAFRLLWNESGLDERDLDAHLCTPEGYIYYSRKKLSKIKGELDIDIINPNGKIAVENIVVEDPVKGVYKFYINKFSSGTDYPFKCQIVLDGEVYEYEIDNSFTKNRNLNIATIKYDGNKFTINHHIDSQNTPIDLWGLQSNNFHKVNLICKSPNHWDSEVGHLDYLFFLDNCYPDSDLKTIHSEHLCNELSNHRRVIEAVSSKLIANPSKDSLAGVGFNSTVNNNITVKVKEKETNKTKLLNLIIK